MPGSNYKYKIELRGKVWLMDRHSGIVSVHVPKVTRSDGPHGRRRLGKKC